MIIFDNGRGGFVISKPAINSKPANQSTGLPKPIKKVENKNGLNFALNALIMLKMH